MMEKFQIKHRWTDAVLFECEPVAGQESGMVARHALEAAVKAGANLRSANLSSADLRFADLRFADLRFADLRFADLRFADLRSADLRFADLRSANLRSANLSSADLRFADLRFADLRFADLRFADLSENIKLAGDRPILMIGPIGSRSDVLHIYLTDAGMHIRAGCFFGTREEFVEALAAEHGENRHGVEYRAALVLADVHAEMWAPKEEPPEVVDLDSASA